MLRIRVHAADGRPAAGLAISVRLDGGPPRAVTLDDAGRARFPSGEALAVRLGTPDGGCLILAGESLAAADAHTPQVVQPAESLITIAARFELPSWRCIWGYAPNAPLRAARGHPFQIEPGDEVFVPAGADVRVPELLRRAGVAVLIHHGVDAPRLELDLADSAGVPIAMTPFRVDWADGSVVDSHTGADGRLTAPMPRGVCTGTLQILERRFELDASGLPGVDAAHGAQTRLNHLNYFCGKVDGALGPRSADALRAFQHAAGLPESGALDAATQAALAEAYGV